jgi:ABC-type multidrug transport system fused ATPase/permease subunit
MMLSRRFWEYIRRHRRAYGLGYAAVLAAIMMAQLSPWALKLAIDGIRGGASSGRLLVYAGALVMIAALEAACSYAMRLQILGAARLLRAPAAPAPRVLSGGADR